MKTKFNGFLTLLLAFMVQMTFAQERTISGVVSDDLGPIDGVAVTVKGTSSGTVTDFNGNYSIKAKTGDVIVFSHISYDAMEKVVGESNVIDLAMKSAGNAIDEIVIKGYGSSSKKVNTSAVVSVSTKDIEDRPNVNVLQNLQGQAAGLNIAIGSGQPGRDSTVILRGIGSINGNLEPVFVVDGIFVDEDNFKGINQNDIATFNVLKDAAATSIYGNRGANGAFIITTKKGRYNQPLEFQYSNDISFSKLPNLNIDLLNTRELLTLERERGVGRGAGLGDAEIEAIHKQTNTSWQDELFRTGISQIHNLSMTSGSESFNNFTSIGFNETEGITLASDLKRFTVRNNFNGRSKNEKFNYNLNLSVSYTKQNESDDDTGSGSTFFNPFGAALAGKPYVSPHTYIEPGDIAAVTGNQAENFPIILLDSWNFNTDSQDEVRILASLGASYKLTDDLTLGYRLGTDYAATNNLEILHPDSILGPFQAQTGANFGGVHSESTFRDFRFTNVVNLTYNKVIKEDHTVNASAYMEYNKDHLKSSNFRQEGLDPRLVGSGAAFIPGNTVENGNQIYVPTIGSGIVSAGLFSYFGTVDYDYKRKYGFAASLRRDASFRFVDDFEWGTFYSLSGRWNINEEDFMKGSKFNNLKLRVSTGTAGNQRILGGNYAGGSLTRTQFTTGGGYNGSTGTYVASNGNPDLSWEVVTTNNVGLDFGVWKNRLSGSVDVYSKKTEDLYQSRRVSLINTVTTLNANIGSLKNEGVELNFKYVVLDKNDLKISVNANSSYNKNEVIELPEFADGRIHAGGSTSLTEGEAINSYYLVPYAGVNPANGNPLFYDIDGNLTEELNDSDRRDTGKSAFPVWQGGFGARITYKGFSLSNQWSYVADVYVNNLDLASLEQTSDLNNGRNRSAGVLNAWQNPGDITDIPRFDSAITSVGYINASDRYLEDASYLRMRNIQLGYSLKKEWAEKLSIKSLKLYVQAENLVTFTNFRGWDAENGFRTTNRGQFPTPQIYSMGLNVKF